MSKSLDKFLAEQAEFESWCHDEDLRLREDAKSDPVLAAILRDADAEYERRYGTAWVNPKAAHA